MRGYFNGDGEGFELRLVVKWQTFTAFVRALLLTIATLTALGAAPHVAPLLERLGK